MQADGRGWGLEQDKTTAKKGLRVPIFCLFYTVLKGIVSLAPHYGKFHFFRLNEHFSDINIKVTIGKMIDRNSSYLIKPKAV